MNDKWLIRYYQRHGRIIRQFYYRRISVKKRLSINMKFNVEENVVSTFCDLKTCLHFHRLCIALRLFSKWSENQFVHKNGVRHSNSSSFNIYNYNTKIFEVDESDVVQNGLKINITTERANDIFEQMPSPSARFSFYVLIFNPFLFSQSLFTLLYLSEQQKA